MNHVRGWRRIGVVVSILWFVGWFAYLWIERAHSYDSGADKIFHACINNGGQFEACWQEREKFAFKPSWELAGIFGFLAFWPIPLAWLVAWVGYRVTRWIRAGFTDAGRAQ